MDSKYWDNVSADAKDWIDKILERSPDKRLTSDEAMRHKWINQVIENKDSKFKKFKLHNEVMMNLHGCERPSKLLYELLILFCQFLNDDDIKAIKETF